MENLLEIALDHEDSPIHGISIYAVVYVDGKKWAEILDIEVFFHAIEHSGRHPLFTCECGCFGCGGYYVDVECTENEWILRNKYDPRSGKRVAEYECRFAWRNVYAEATKIRDYIHEFCKHQVGGIIASGVSGAFDANTLFEGKHMISLREASDRIDQAMFDRYLAIVEAEAKRIGRIFYLHSEESCNIRWEEKGLEMASLSGWLLEPEEMAELTRWYNDYNQGNDIQGLSEKYYPKLRGVEWSLTKNGDLSISFTEEEG